MHLLSTYTRQVFAQLCKQFSVQLKRLTLAEIMCVFWNILIHKYKALRPYGTVLELFTVNSTIQCVYGAVQYTYYSHTMNIAAQCIFKLFGMLSPWSKTGNITENQNCTVYGDAELFLFLIMCVTFMKYNIYNAKAENIRHAYANVVKCSHG